MRAASSYRGARRNAHRGLIWGAPDCYYKDFQPNRIRRSYISKRPSKYMPHDGGKGYIPTEPTIRSIRKEIGSSIMSVIGKVRKGFRR